MPNSQPRQKQVGNTETKLRKPVDNQADRNAFHVA